jgi:PAS domain S-box-containing protein
MAGPVSATYEHFLQLVEALPLIAWIADPAGEVVHFNQAFADFTGMPVEDALGQGYVAIFHPDDLPGARELWGTCLSTGQTFENVHRYRRADGAFRWQLVRAVPFYGPGGGIVQWIGTCTDIDDQRRANDASQFLAQASAELARLAEPRLTLERIGALAVPGFADWATIDFVGSEGRIERLSMAHTDPELIEVARQMEQRFPTPREPATTVIRTGEPSWTPDITAEALAAFAVDLDHLAWLQAVGPRSVLCVPLRLGGQVAAAVTFVFSNSGRRYRDIDRLTALDLAQRAEVAFDNARLYEELRLANRQKSEFLAMLAHELRNPLAPLRSGLEVVSARLAAEGAVRAALVTMDRQLGHLEHLIDDLLDAERMSRGAVRMRREPVVVTEVLEAAIETVDPALQAAGHRFVRTGLVPDQTWIVRGDVTRLAQVFGNLLLNAARYTAPSGEIQLDVQRDDSHLEVTVIDNGIGLRSDELERIFELFYRADERGAGLGVGLALVRRIVEQHGGQIVARSAGPGTGSAFAVRLPLEPAPSPVPAPVVGPSAATPLRIVLADDNREGADLLAASLQMFGHELHVVYDGVSAFARIEELRPDVALLDIGMPVLDGRELARRIRREPWGKDIVLVALTGWGQAEDKRASARAGFDHHFTKPVKRASLQELFVTLPRAKRGG